MGLNVPLADAGEEHAGFAVRLMAYVIDLFLISVISLVFYFVTLFIRSSLADTLVYLFNTFFVGGYLVYFWATRGQTPGKRALGLQIVGPTGGSNGIGFGRALLRLLGYAISGLVFWLGFLWIIWDPQKQGWHDKLAGTNVVKLGL